MKKQFELGDEAIALSSAERPNQPRKKGRSYTVTSIFYCPTKGDQMINIDYTKSNSRSLNCGCGKKHNTGDNLSYTYSTNFTKREDLESALEEALENENYDAAVVIRNLKKKEQSAFNE